MDVQVPRSSVTVDLDARILGKVSLGHPVILHLVDPGSGNCGNLRILDDVSPDPEPSHTRVFCSNCCDTRSEGSPAAGRRKRPAKPRQPVGTSVSVSSEPTFDHEGRRVFTCTLCDYTSKLKPNLKRHYLGKHSMPENAAVALVSCT